MAIPDFPFSQTAPGNMQRSIGNADVTVLGLGYIGCVTSACLAHLGHKVVGVDPDSYKVDCVNGGIAPFHEPGLGELLNAAVSAGRLVASTSIADGLQSARIAMVCVGTPSAKNGGQNLEHLRRVCGQIADQMRNRQEPLIVAIRSTVYPGTCEAVVTPILSAHPAIRVVSNPEFLREGVAVNDFLHPGLHVIGGSDLGSMEQLAALYSGLDVPPCLVSLRTAEMIKYACNAFHAVKIAFANEIGALCAARGVSGPEVMETLCQDAKLNISTAYLKPGFAFGGSCLPKDLRALSNRAHQDGVRSPLLNSVLESNDLHLDRLIRQVLELPSQRLAVYGLAFKEDTDDLRESPAVTLLEHLIGKGRQVRVFDPSIDLDRVHGANQAFLLKAIPHIGKLLERDLHEFLLHAEHVVLVQKPAARHLELIQSSRLPVLDLIHALPAATWAKTGAPRHPSRTFESIAPPPAALLAGD